LSLEEKKNTKSVFENMFKGKDQPLANSINTEYTNASKSSNSSQDTDERINEKNSDDNLVNYSLFILGATFVAIGG